MSCAQLKVLKIEHAGSFLEDPDFVFEFTNAYIFNRFSFVSDDDLTVTNTKALENSPLPGDSISVRAQNVLSSRLMTFSFS